MTTQPSEVRLELGSTDLSDTDLQTMIDKARRFYEAQIDGEPVPDELKDDVVASLAAWRVKRGPEPEVTSGGDADFNIPEKGRHWQAAVAADPTGQLGGDRDGDTDHFTLSI